MSRLRIDASEFGALLKEADKFDRKFQLYLRREMRAAGKPLIGKMRHAVKNAPKGRGSSIRQKRKRRGKEVDVVTHTSDLIAKGISVRIDNNKNGAAVRFASSSKFLPKKDKGAAGPSDRTAMTRAFNKKRPFRHPVIGTTTEPVKGGKPGERKPRPPGQWRWVDQAPRPYFGSVILAEGVKPMEDAIYDAWDKATAVLSRLR